MAQAQPQLAERLCPHLPHSAPDLEALAEQHLRQEAVQHWVGQLPARLARVIVARYGLAGDQPQTFAASGRTLDVTRQRAHQLHQEALLWLGHPAHSLAVRQLLERNTTADYRAYLAQLRCWLRARRRP